MKEQLHSLAGPDGAPISKTAFGPTVVGELYLFHRNDPRCPSEGSLWGVFEGFDGSDLLLESSSGDLLRFRLRDRLPADYRYVRQATRAELRDYFFLLAFSEVRRG